MKKIYYILLLILYGNISSAQKTSSSKIPISISYSENGIYSIKSTSYDDEFATLRGKSEIYKNNEKLYSINRSFDLYDSAKFRLIISNDGSTIIYFTDHCNYKGDEFKNVTIYRYGKLLKSYSSKEFVNCDYKKEKCGLFYKTSEWKITESQKKATNKTIDIEKERFLINNFLLVNNEFIYLIDPRKKVTKYNINKLEVVNRLDFDTVYDTLKTFSKPKSKIKYYEYYTKKHTYLCDIKEINSKKTLSEGIANLFKLKFVDHRDKYSRARYQFELEGYIIRGGKFEIEKLEVDTIFFDKQKIIEYLNNTSFDVDSIIPSEVNRLFKDSFYGVFRPRSSFKSKRRIKKIKLLERENYKKRLLLDSIDGIYIPKNLNDTNRKLDSLLSFENKKEILKTENRRRLNSHLGGLGMWIRNNWGINGGSRLVNYFYKRKIYNRDKISGIIIEQYIKWLEGDENAYKKWEKENP